MVETNTQIQWGLCLLRFGLGIFLILWSIDKIVAPEATVKIFSHFYFVPITPSIAIIVGALELVLSLFFILGTYKTLTYGLATLIHGISTVSSFEQLLAPFGKNHLFIAAIPVLFAFIALFLCRTIDTRFTLSKKRSLFS